MSERDLIERLRNFGDLGNGTTNDAMNLCNEAATAIDRLSEALAEAEKKGAEDWQPIETAPKDGTMIDLWARRETTGKFDRYTECQWGRRNFGSEPYGESVWLGLQDQYSVITPTHWRPLPAPPRDLSQGGQHG